MDESANKNSGARKEPPHAEGSENAAANDGAAARQQAAAGKGKDGGLPIVWSPRLDAGDAMADDAAPADDNASSASTDETVKEAPRAAATPSRMSRFAVLAASVALAAALGSFVGSLSASGFVHPWPAEAPGPARLAYAPPAAKAQRELAALKASVDATARGANSQFARLADRLDRMERAQSEPAAKLAHMADVLDRLAKRTLAAAAAAPDITGSIPPPNPTKPAQKVLQDWIVHGVQDGRALIESRYGGLYDVATGNVLPGAGRVEAIKRQDGEWVVVTARGIITSGR